MYNKQCITLVLQYGDDISLYNHKVLIKVLSVFSAAAFRDASATTSDEDYLCVGAPSERVRVVISVSDLVLM